MLKNLLKFSLLCCAINQFKSQPIHPVNAGGYFQETNKKISADNSYLPIEDPVIGEELSYVEVPQMEKFLYAAPPSNLGIYQQLQPAGGNPSVEYYAETFQNPPKHSDCLIENLGFKPKEIAEQNVSSKSPGSSHDQDSKTLYDNEQSYSWVNKKLEEPETKSESDVFDYYRSFAKSSDGNGKKDDDESSTNEK